VIDVDIVDHEKRHIELSGPEATNSTIRAESSSLAQTSDSSRHTDYMEKLTTLYKTTELQVPRTLDQFYDESLDMDELQTRSKD
jgi:hypothetical protein